MVGQGIAASLILPDAIERQQPFADGLVSGAGFRVIVKEIDLHDIALLAGRLDLDQNLADKRRDGVDRSRNG